MGATLSGWTTHGHRIDGQVQVGTPDRVARCGGPGLCAKCSRQAAAVAKIVYEPEAPRRLHPTGLTADEINRITLTVGFAHEDGRECAFWNRERKWVTVQHDDAFECLREDHPARIPTTFHRAPAPGGFVQRGSEGGCYS